MGWRGTLRTLEAASRRMQREQEREHKRLLLLRKQSEKMDSIERARNEVELYESHIARLLSVHKQCSDQVDWQALANKPGPLKPEPQSTHKQAALSALQAYKPSLIDRLFGRIEQKRKILEHNVQVAIQRDQDEYKIELSKHGDEVAEWEATRELALGVLKGDQAAFYEALKHCDPFEDIRELGSAIKIDFQSGQIADVTFQANGPEVIPTEAKSLLKSGKVTVKKMPTGTYWELYQDYVCGCILRIGRELFAVLPTNKAIVTATAEILNSATGHMEATPIASALLVRETIDKLNFDKLDCSDSLKNFVHNMGFKRSAGFSAVQKIAPN